MTVLSRAGGCAHRAGRNFSATSAPSMPGGP